MMWIHEPANSAWRRTFVDGANASFAGGWGDERLFDWAFLRPGAGRRADLLFAMENGKALAGSGVVFRKVRNGDDRFLAAIITGSWTLPEARGRRLFSSLVSRQVEVARKAGADVLLGFVTAANASARRMAEAGSTLFASAYCRGPMAPGPVVVRDSENGHRAVFEYDEEEWQKQFLERPASEAISIVEEERGFVVLERSSDFDRVHFIRGDPARLADLAAESARNGRRLFCFTTRPAVRDALQASGFEIVPGFVTAISTGIRPVAELVTGWDLQNGDRI